MVAVELSESKMYQLRELYGIIFLALVGLLVCLALFVSYQFLKPTDSGYYYAVGDLVDYPPSASPYVFQADSLVVYVVNNDRRLMVFNARTPATTRCLFKWQEGNHRFEDPCSGSKFTFDGLYIEGPSARGLDMHPVYVNNAQEIMIHFDSIMLGWSASPSAAPECVRAVQEADLIAGVGCAEFGHLPEQHAVPYPEQLRRHFRTAPRPVTSEWYSEPVKPQSYYCTPPLIKC